ncbi:uncharacterized protein LOC114167572 isoform X2 [Vigna unguiculata]|uniref:uncharacterized protein LOC114167572 isoform X2 n=1 Tax=Vigna unguiculata TaxID=3917 RepID=UPI001016FBCC|nr:uncharacterized protein LOC114167572 isoform X2 [Vigna unguiculata]
MTEPRSLPSHFTLCVHSLLVRVFLLSPHLTLSFLISLSSRSLSAFTSLHSPFTSLHSPLRTFPHLSVRSPLRSLTSPFALRFSFLLFSSSFPLFHFTSFSFLLPSPPFAPSFAPQSTIAAVRICSIGLFGSIARICASVHSFSVSGMKTCNKEDT